MDVTNRNALEEILYDRLQRLETCEVGSEEAHKLLKEIKEIEAVLNQGLEMKKSEQKAAEDEERRKLELEKLELEKRKLELSTLERKENKILKIVEIAVPLSIFVLDCAFKTYFMKSVCNFEKDYTFTTTAGRSLSSLFKFKR